MSELLALYERSRAYLNEENLGWLTQVGALALGMLLAWLITRRVLLRGVAYVVERTSTQWDDAVLERGVFRKLALLAPGLVAYYGGYLLDGNEATAIAQRLVSAYLVAVLVAALGAFVSALHDIYAQDPARTRTAPIKGYVQVTKLVIFLTGAIVVFAILLDESPWALLSGLGAATAILLLVFRDTILSFVASIQIAQNDTLRVGDWISMPKYDADGDVIDVALHTVRIQNWDKSITSIPTHQFLDESFRNWRGMLESGGRRIKRALLVDQTSVRFLGDDEIARLRRVSLLRSYLDEKLEALEAANRGKDLAKSPLEGRRLTNLGTFRAYVAAYLLSHPDIRDDMTFLVRQLEPTPAGLPLEIYCFSRDQRWAAFESIQADIFDHLIAALPELGLSIYQAPGGADLRALRPPAGA